jgi:hypothetical protein
MLSQTQQPPGLPSACLPAQQTCCVLVQSHKESIDWALAVQTVCASACVHVSVVTQIESDSAHKHFPLPAGLDSWFGGGAASLEGAPDIGCKQTAAAWPLFLGFI